LVFGAPNAGALLTELWEMNLDLSTGVEALAT
jgi:hypothetical protein